METLKLRTKIGEHEFEAEGPTDIVQAQFLAFKELIADMPNLKDPMTGPPKLANGGDRAELPHLPLEKILRAEGRVVSLTAKCESVEEAVLLILLGQKEQRGNQQVTGAEIMDGLKFSGYRIARVDRVVDKLAAEGTVITIGAHRARRYRLSNSGLDKALEIASEVLATVP